MRYCTLLLLLPYFVLTTERVAVADIIFVDFANIDARLDDATAAAGTSAFSASEKSQIQDNIFSGVSAAFSAFTGLSFTTADPGGNRSTLNFGLTSSGGLGVADHIDFLNRVVNDTARVFTGNFGFVLENGDSKAAQIAELSAALTGTAVHELGHNLGLRHHDSYGDIEYTGLDVATGGVQNLNWMATGSTGLNESERETVRKFSVNSLVKLAYAEGTLDNNPSTAGEDNGDAGETLATAQEISFDTIDVANAFGEVVEGTIFNSSDIDLFKVNLAAGSVFTADINVDFAGTFDNVDTTIEFLDSFGNILHTDVRSGYSGDNFGSSFNSGDGFDPAFFNIPIAQAGDYFVRVSSTASDSTGEYNLLLHTNALSAVPEPSALTLVSLVLVHGFTRRNRRSRS